eukprot:4052259-Amphidinium_carterae.1
MLDREPQLLKLTPYISGELLNVFWHVEGEGSSASNIWLHLMCSLWVKVYPRLPRLHTSLVNHEMSTGELAHHQQIGVPLVVLIAMAGHCSLVGCACHPMTPSCVTTQSQTPHNLFRVLHMWSVTIR